MAGCAGGGAGLNARPPVDAITPNTGRIDMHRLHPVGRLAGNLYTHVHDIFEMKRPVENYAG